MLLYFIMETILRKLEDLKIDSKIFKKFESSFQEQVDAEVFEDQFNNDGFDPWEGTEQVIGTLCREGIKFTDDDQDSVSVPIECWDTNKQELVDGGFVNVQGWKEVDN